MFASFFIYGDAPVIVEVTGGDIVDGNQPSFVLSAGNDRITLHSMDDAGLDRLVESVEKLNDTVRSAYLRYSAIKAKINDQTLPLQPQED